MSHIAGSAWWLLVTLGLLVTFHEFGHYWVARRCGVKVLRFSVGFGRALWSRLGRDGTEYVVAMIPLGGYVKMLDAREGDVPAAERTQEFTGKPVWQRIAIVAAGPLFNLLFAVAAFWLMFVVGKPDYLPLVGRAEALAAQAGFRPGDRVEAVGDTPVANWTDLGLALADAAAARRAVAVRVQAADGSERVRTLALDTLPSDLDERAQIARIGLVPQQILIPAVIGAVEPGSAAAAAGLRPGDRILRVGGRALQDWSDLTDAIRAEAAPGKPLAIEIARGADRITVQAMPRQEKQADGSTRFMLGVGAQPVDAHYDTVLRRGPLAALPAAIGETRDLTGQTLGMLGRMLTGHASLQNLSGPITIAKYANASAQMGLAWFLYFLGIISLSLAIMNLLPIPILDGGHLLYYLIELVKGSPVSERVVQAGQYVGMALLAALMGLAFYNDILRLAS
ncbi:RIP metalloprotease RseP [Mizugakiibacter sediminis]|uniref:RIP metalloprotease RseP n=1 Tax=Mizugakiibacter sediminis TaxID=1475481 RepID=UPI003CCD0659